MRTSFTWIVALWMAVGGDQASAESRPRFRLEDGVAVVEGIMSRDEHERTLGQLWRREDVRAIVDLSYVGGSPASETLVARSRKSGAGIISDAALRRTIQNALLVDPRVQARRIRVDVRAGSVHLTGEVGSKTARKAAEADAWNVRGVTAVQSDLDVAERKRLRSDAALVRAARNALQADAGIDDRRIILIAQQGKLRLLGSVAAEYERRHASRLASTFVGARGVVNELQVAKPAVPGTEADAASPPSAKVIYEALSWSPFVDAKRIVVRRRGRIYWLSGYADSVAERQEAERIARSLGAAALRNELKIGSSRNPVARPKRQ
jgi:osmotically-inducible protein OsmY